MKVAIRADASIAIGSGHVMRCLALADTLRRRGAETRFLCRRQPGHLGDLIAARGHALSWLPADIGAGEDARLCRTALAEGADWLVADHYGLDAEWETTLATVARSLLVIDDLADRPHACDLLLDQNLFADPAGRYARLLLPHCRTLLGPVHALLRPEFRQLAKLQPDRARGVGRVLVFLGGSDADNCTGRVLTMLDGHPGLAVDVVAGAVHPAAAALARWCYARAGARLIPAGGNFPALLAAADLAIGAGGTTTWERCCLGLPSLVLGVADNQHTVAAAVAGFGAHLYLGPAAAVTDRRLQASLDVLLDSPELRRHMAAQGRALVDGIGAERVADAMLPELGLTLSPAKPTDAQLIFAWRNARETRRYFFNPAALTEAEHACWFEQVLADPDRILLVARDGERPIGAIRYDIVGAEAAISVFLAPDARGLGLGRRLIRSGSRWLAGARPTVRYLQASIHPDNRASQTAFADAGFVECERHYRLDL